MALHPEGRRASIERLAFHPVAEQVRAIADTALDRELERRSRGEARALPEAENRLERAALKLA